MQQEQGHKRETLDFVSNEQLPFFFPFHLNVTLQCTRCTVKIAFSLKKAELVSFSSSYSQPKYKISFSTSLKASPLIQVSQLSSHMRRVLTISVTRHTRKQRNTASWGRPFYSSRRLRHSTKASGRVRTRIHDCLPAQGPSDIRGVPFFL